MKTINSILISCLLLSSSLIATARNIQFCVNPTTCAISELKVENDPTSMNWIVATDGSQYDFIGEKYGWGLGYFTTSDGVRHDWQKPVATKGKTITYRASNVQITVKRELKKGEIIETYTFKNIGGKRETLSDIGIYTPFNDNYPNSVECVNRRCNAHIWNGGNSAYVCALRMGGYAPHVGLVLTEGNIDNYEIWERGMNRYNSQTRGIIALCPKDMTLDVGKSTSIQWTVFSFDSKNEFKDKAAQLGCVIPSSSLYVLGVGETAEIHYGDKTKTVKADKAGEMRVELPYGKGKSTHAELLVIKNIDSLIASRADFILNRQRMTDTNDGRFGAFMVYDNEGDSIYPNNTYNCSPVDRDEGAERIGMGVFLAKHHIATGKKDVRLERALVDYAAFIRKKLQTPDFKTYSSIDHKQRNRAYNYVWVADYDFLMYEITGDKKYAEYGYRTLRSMCDQFGHSFYAIGFPVIRGVKALECAGMNTECVRLKDDFTQIAESYIANGINYPAHEVNYEQSIVAPAAQLLCEMYLLTNDKKYLTAAQVHMPLVDSFNGFQPSYHLNDVAIRHWDGYWFGKSEMFGDTFPHYWSTITASVFHLYAKCTGDESYQKRAENIVRNNLCLFSEDGKGSCAYLNPKRVNGEKASFYDAYANDQDWALAYWYQVNNDI